MSDVDVFHRIRAKGLKDETGKDVVVAGKAP
jgi:hypothetical protein